MIAMLSSEVIRLHVLLDRGHSLIAAVGGGDWQGQSGPWQYAAIAWQNEFEQVRKQLSTKDCSSEPAEIRTLPHHVRELVRAADHMIHRWGDADEQTRQEIWGRLARASGAVRHRDMAE